MLQQSWSEAVGVTLLAAIAAGWQQGQLWAVLPLVTPALLWGSPQRDPPLQQACLPLPLPVSAAD